MVLHATAGSRQHSKQLLMVDARLDPQHIRRVRQEINDVYKSTPERGLGTFLGVEKLRIMQGSCVGRSPPPLTHALGACFGAHDPGGVPERFHSFESDDDVPLRYRADDRFTRLCQDSAQGSKVTQTSRKEAMTALQLEAEGQVAQGVRRPAEPRIDFRDGNGVPYDIKTPFWNLTGAAKSILRKAGAEYGDETLTVAVDTTYLTERDYALLCHHVGDEIASSEARQHFNTLERALGRTDADLPDASFHREQLAHVMLTNVELEDFP